DPSEADTSALEYFWQINNGPWQKTDTAELELPEDEYPNNTMITVSGYIAVEGGARSATQTIDVFIGGGAGTFLPPGMIAPPGYFQNITHYLQSVTVDPQPAGQAATVVFTPNDVRQKEIPPGWFYAYQYTITI